ncbi:MAG TPA: hypothetical protein VLF90_03865 [Patescibacteria group bacterium]|nr:hypothetical protein [Patescibacteria group bacterium]
MDKGESANFSGREQTVDVARAALMLKVAKEEGNMSINIVRWPGEGFTPPGCDMEVALCSPADSKEKFENVRLIISGQENASVNSFYRKLSRLEAEIRDSRKPNKDYSASKAAGILSTGESVGNVEISQA